MEAFVLRTSFLVQTNELPLHFESALSSTSSTPKANISYSFLDGRHKLRCWLSGPTKEWVNAWQNAAFDIALVVQKEFFMVLCRFGKEGWMMTSFQWHHIPMEKRVRPDLWNGANIEILFLDASTDQLLGERTVVCGPEFTASLCGAILMQSARKWVGDRAYEHALREFQQTYTSAESLVPLATARTLDIPSQDVIV